jgi:O-antigen/teichoic acid export membrane protein
MSVFEHIKSTFKQTSILTATAVLQKSIGFIMLPIYAHYLRGEGYGVLGMLGVLTQLMSVVIGSGLAGGIQRYYFLEVSDFDKNRIVSTGILLLFLLSICISIPALMGSRLISWLLFGKQDFAFFVVLTVITFIANISSYGGEAYILVRKKIYFYSILSLTRLSIALGLNIYLIVYRQMGVLGAICTNLVAATFVSLAINLKSLFSVGLHFEWNAAKKILKYNLPMVPGFILWFVKNNMDKIILRSFLGVEFLGVYMMLSKFVSLITVFITEPFLKIWNVKRLEVCEKEEGPRLMAKVFNLQTSMVLFLGLVLSIEIPYILQIMTPEEFWLPGLYALFAILQPILYGIYHHLNFGII